MNKKAEQNGTTEDMPQEESVHEEAVDQTLEDQIDT